VAENVGCKALNEHLSHFRVSAFIPRPPSVSAKSTSTQFRYWSSRLPTWPAWTTSSPRSTVPSEQYACAYLDKVDGPVRLVRWFLVRWFARANSGGIARTMFARRPCVPNRLPLPSGVVIVYMNVEGSVESTPPRNLHALDLGASGRQILLVLECVAI
jgi:hypothetical protein